MDLRALPVVRAPSRSETDSSDSEAEVRATLNKRRKERSKIVAGMLYIYFLFYLVLRYMLHIISVVSSSSGQDWRSHFEGSTVVLPLIWLNFVEEKSSAKSKENSKATSTKRSRAKADEDADVR